MMMVLAMVSGVFAANTSTTVPLNATVKSMCANTAAGVAELLDIDPSATGVQAFSITTQPVVQCTNKAVATITATSANGTASSVACNGSNYLTGFTLKETGGKTVDYEFACEASVTGIGIKAGDAARNLSLGVAAQVPETNAQAAEYTGTNYSDVVTLTITY